MTNTRKKKAKEVKAWAGFTSGQLDRWIACDEYDYADGIHTNYAIFRTRAEAKARYQDVRRVVIREVL